MHKSLFGPQGLSDRALAWLFVAPTIVLLPAFHETLLFLAGLAILAAGVSSTRRGDAWQS